MIRVHHLTKQFQDSMHGSVTALEDVSFEVYPGQIFGLLGANGAGKTTCLRILSTILRPSTGTVQVAGFNLSTQAASIRSHIGVVSDNTRVYDGMTGAEYVRYFGRLYGIDTATLRSRMASLFDTLQMNEFRDVLGSKMSTGTRRKVSIARALVHDPPVLILDEPTSGLDVMAARAVLDSIAALKQQGKCIIYSTHNMREVEKLCDQVAIIHQGKLLATGTVQEFLARYGQPDMEEVFFGLLSRDQYNSAA